MTEAYKKEDHIISEMQINQRMHLTGVSRHAELHLLLSMITPLSWLERAPTYKDQSEKFIDKALIERAEHCANNAVLTMARKTAQRTMEIAA